METYKKDALGRLRVCAYCRVSTGTEAQMGSYDNQIEIYTEKINSNPDWVFAGIYADPALSGTNDKRPEFSRMMADARKHRFDLILVKSISRFARNTVLAIESIKMLQSYGVGCIFEKENIDTSKEYSEMLLTILSAFAQEESRNISERCKNGLRMRNSNGQISWYNLYGFRNYFVPVEEEAAVVRRIFDEYEHGKTPTEISDGLNRDGIVSPGGKDWHYGAVQKILGNERYAGDVLTNKGFTKDHISHKYVKNNGQVKQYYYRDHHEKIVSHEQFDRVQEMIKMRKDHTYPFGTKLRSPYSGKGFTMENYYGTFSLYACADDNFYVKRDVVERAILEAYKDLDTFGITDPLTKKIKEEHPEMETAEYWWIDDLVDEITFTKDGPETMIVRWICGKESRIPIPENKGESIRRYYGRLEKEANRAAKEKKVTIIPANPKYKTSPGNVKTIPAAQPVTTSEV